MRIKFFLTLVRHLKIKSFEKGKIIIERDSTQDKLFYIRKGLVRSYYYNDNGDEITFQLFPESNFFGNVHAIFLKQPSKFDYEALEKTKVYTVDFASFRRIMKENADRIELDKNFMFQSMMSQLINRMESFVLLSPEERYQKYVKEYPNLINRTPDKYIASVLGITPVSLSRIRGRIASRK